MCDDAELKSKVETLMECWQYKGSWEDWSHYKQGKEHIEYIDPKKIAGTLLSQDNLKLVIDYRFTRLLESIKKHRWVNSKSGGTLNLFKLQGKYFVINGNRRAILANVLDIPKVRCTVITLRKKLSIT